MTESDNLWEAPASTVVGNNFIVHRPLINLIAAMVSWSFGIFGLLFAIVGVLGLKNSIDHRGGWEVVLSSKAGLFQAGLLLTFVVSTVLFLTAGYSFFRVNNRRGLIRFSAALAVGPVPVLTLYCIDFRVQ